MLKVQHVVELGCAAIPVPVNMVCSFQRLLGQQQPPVYEMIRTGPYMFSSRQCFFKLAGVNSICYDLLRPTAQVTPCSRRHFGGRDSHHRLHAKSFRSLPKLVLDCQRHETSFNKPSWLNQDQMLQSRFQAGLGLDREVTASTLAAKPLYIRRDGS